MLGKVCSQAVLARLRTPPLPSLFSCYVNCKASPCLARHISGRKYTYYGSGSEHAGRLRVCYLVDVSAATAALLLWVGRARGSALGPRPWSLPNPELLPASSRRSSVTTPFALTAQRPGSSCTRLVPSREEGSGSRPPAGGAGWRLFPEPSGRTLRTSEIRRINYGGERLTGFCGKYLPTHLYSSQYPGAGRAPPNQVPRMHSYHCGGCYVLSPILVHARILGLRWPVARILFCIERLCSRLHVCRHQVDILL